MREWGAGAGMWSVRTVRDHRGVRVPLYAARSGAAAERDGFSAEEYRLVRQRVGEGSVFELLTHPAFLVIATVLVGAGVVHRTTMPGQGSVPAALIGLGGLLLLALWLRGRIPPAAARHTVGALLELRRCPSCAFRLGDSPAEADRCVVCPECGAAWRLPTNIFEGVAGVETGIETGAAAAERPAGEGGGGDDRVS